MCGKVKYEQSILINSLEYCFNLVLEVASGEYGEAIPLLVLAANLHRNSQGILNDSNDNVEHIKTFPTSCITQFWIILKRTFKTTLRDKQLMHLQVAAHIIVGAIIGMIYYDIGNEGSKVLDNLSCIFFTMLFTMFTGMMSTILTCTLTRHELIFARIDLSSLF